MQKLNSIGTQIILFLLICSLVSLMVGFFCNYSYLEKALHETEENRILAASRTIQHVLDNEVQTLQLLARNLQGSKELISGLFFSITNEDYKSCREIITRKLPSYDGRGLVITDDKGRTLYSYIENIPLAKQYDVWGVDEAIEGETVFSAGSGPDGWAMRVIMPLIQGETVVGTLILTRSVDISLLEQLAKAVDMQLGLFSLDGLELVVKPVASEQPFKSNVIEESLVSRSPNTITHNPDHNFLTLYSSVRLADQVFCLGLNKITTVIQDQLNEQRIEFLKFTLLLFVAIMFTGILFTAHLIRPLQSLYLKTGKIIHKLDHQTQPVVCRGNEIQTVNQAFDLLQKTLLEHLEARQEAEDKLVGFNRKLQVQMEELQESKHYLATLFASIEDAIFILEPDGTVRSLNYKSTSLLGCPKEQVIGYMFGNFLEDQGWEGSCRSDSNFETRLRCADGHFVDILLSGAVLREENGIQNGFICVAKDITELKAARKKEKKQDLQTAHSGRLAAIGEMSTGIAHEINQPLAIIRLAAQYLQQKLAKEKDERVRGTIQKIIDQIDRVTRIIKNMRSFARSGDDQGVGPTNCAEAIDNALFFFREQFRVRSIELVENLAQDLPDGLLNGQQLQQIVVNLLSNARDSVEEQAAKKGKDYRMTVQVRLQRTAENLAIFEVRDNGVGMTAEVKEKCLDSFFTTKEEDKGTGLGLSIVKSLAQELNMVVTVKSESGKGCLFQLTYHLVKDGGESGLSHESVG